MRKNKLPSCLPLVILVLLILPAAGVMAANSQHAAGEHAPHWGYTGSAGPANWGSLSGEYVLCGSGKRQSPVDIGNEVFADLYPLEFQYQSIPLLVLNNGHTLQANYSTFGKEEKVVIGGKPYPIQTKPIYNSVLMVGDLPYKLLQLHFHAPSEHAYGGRRSAMEVHLVHKSSDGNLAVVGVMLERGSENPALKKVLEYVSTEINKVRLVQGVNINATDLLPSDREVFHYNGSLTTPPCSENVNWFVMKTPVEVSDSQVRQFEKMIGNNARPLQSMHWRQMLTSE